jgi:hypothetical protein
LYVNGIQGDPDKVVDLSRPGAVLSQLKDFGDQMMHLGPPGSTTTATPNPAAPPGRAARALPGGRAPHPRVS